MECEPPAPVLGPRSGRPLSQSSPSTSAAPQIGAAGSEASRKKYDHRFKIITAKRTFIVCATSEEDEIRWLSAIRVLLAAIRRSNSPGRKASSSAAAAPITTVSPPTPSLGGSGTGDAVGTSRPADSLPSIETQLGASSSTTQPSLISRSRTSVYYCVFLLVQFC
jgi:hypothetical protein